MRTFGDLKEEDLKIDSNDLADVHSVVIKTRIRKRLFVLLSTFHCMVDHMTIFKKKLKLDLKTHFEKF